MFIITPDPPQFTAEYVQPESANCTVLDNSRSMISCAAIMGSRTTFLCDVTGNPMPQLTHTFSGVGDLQVENGNIVIESVMEASAGNYTCTAMSSERFPLDSAKRQFQFFVGGKMIILLISPLFILYHKFNAPCMHGNFHQDKVFANFATCSH